MKIIHLAVLVLAVAFSGCGSCGNSVQSVTSTPSPTAGAPAGGGAAPPKFRVALSKDTGGASLASLYSALTGSPASIFSFTPAAPSVLTGFQIALGDIDGDGEPEIFVAHWGSGESSQLITYNGRTRASEYFYPFGSFTGGLSIATGDVNGDGVPDLLVCKKSGTPALIVYLTGDPTPHLISPFPGTSGGCRVATGNVFNTTSEDIVLTTGSGGNGDVLVMQYPSTVLTSFTAYSPPFSHGISVATARLRGNPYAEIILAPEGSAPSVVSVRDQWGVETANFAVYSGLFTGGLRLGSVQMNGDGKASILVGTGAGKGEVQWFNISGMNATLGGSFSPFGPSYTNGMWVAGWPK